MLEQKRDLSPVHVPTFSPEGAVLLGQKEQGQIPSLAPCKTGDPFSLRIAEILGTPIDEESSRIQQVIEASEKNNIYVAGLRGDIDSSGSQTTPSWRKGRSVFWSQDSPRSSYGTMDTPFFDHSSQSTDAETSVVLAVRRVIGDTFGQADPTALIHVKLKRDNTLADRTIGQIAEQHAFEALENFIINGFSNNSIINETFTANPASITKLDQQNVLAQEERKAAEQERLKLQKVKQAVINEELLAQAQQKSALIDTSIYVPEVTVESARRYHTLNVSPEEEPFTIEKSSCEQPVVRNQILLPWARSLRDGDEWIIDLGAGIGGEARWLSEQGYKTFAVEPSKTLSEKNMNKYIAQGYAEDVASLFLENSAKGAYIKDCLLWMSPEQREQMLDGLGKVIIPNGTLLIITQEIEFMADWYSYKGSFVPKTASFDSNENWIQKLKEVGYNDDFGRIYFSCMPDEVNEMCKGTQFELAKVTRYGKDSPLSQENRWIDAKYKAATYVYELVNKKITTPFQG